MFYLKDICLVLRIYIRGGPRYTLAGTRGTLIISNLIKRRQNGENLNFGALYLRNAKKIK